MIGFEFNMEKMASFQDQFLGSLESSLSDLNESDFIQEMKKLKDSAPAVLVEIPIDRFCEATQQDSAVCNATKALLGLDDYNALLQVPELETANNFHEPSGTIIIQKGKIQKEYAAVIRHPHASTDDQHVEAQCVQTQFHDLAIQKGQLLHSIRTYTNCELPMERTENGIRALYTTHSKEDYLATAVEQDGVYYDVFPLTYGSEYSHSVYFPDSPEPPLFDGWLL
ncbi:MAG: hypothetical protein ABII18_05670 [bacterium]|nr:hypothetical protein [bacterium]MBU1919159.1 hypothetical protein [bacterium]